MFSWIGRKLRRALTTLFPSTSIRATLHRNHRQVLSGLEQIKQLRLQDLETLRKFEPIQDADENDLQELLFSFEKMKRRSLRRQRNNSESKQTKYSNRKEKQR